MVSFDGHHFGTQMPRGGHPPHQFEICFFGSRLTPWRQALTIAHVAMWCSSTACGIRRHGSIRDTAPVICRGFLRGFLLCAPLTAARAAPIFHATLGAMQREAEDDFHYRIFPH